MEWAVSEQYTPLAFGCGGQPDLCHGWRRHCVQGAAGLTRDELGALAQVSSRLIEQYEPYAMVHGHTHLNYSTSYQRLREYQNTKIINAYERYLLKIHP